MNIKITSFINPFSFHCILDDGKNVDKDRDVLLDSIDTPSSKIDIAGVNHGQYVAVMWQNRWVRGIVTLEHQFLIWLVDYGIHLRPTEQTVYTPLPTEYKNHPTKVFEASIHGVTPVSRTLNEMIQIEDVVSDKWDHSTSVRVEKLIKDASRVVFVPIAVLTTKQNDIVLGDVYFETSPKCLSNLIDELHLWPVLCERNKEMYIKNTGKYYSSRRKHRASILKPAFPGIELPNLTLDSSLSDYNSVVTKARQFEASLSMSDDDSDTGSVAAGSAITDATCIESNQFKQSARLTPAEIEKYANEYIVVSGRRYNMLNVLLNKTRDLYICEKYKDAKSVGRATTRLRH